MYLRKLLAMMGVALAVATGITVAGPASPAHAAVGSRIQKVNTNLCLVARNAPGENPVKQVPCDYYDDQYWYPEQVAIGYDSFWSLPNSHSWKCIVTRGAGESRAVVTACDSRYRDQLWSMEYTSLFGGGWRFRNLNSNLCLVVRTNNPEAYAIQSTCGPWPDQVFRWL
jgi:hypothetical protein